MNLQHRYTAEAATAVVQPQPSIWGATDGLCTAARRTGPDPAVSHACDAAAAYRLAASSVRKLSSTDDFFEGMEVFLFLAVVWCRLFVVEGVGWGRPIASCRSVRLYDTSDPFSEIVRAVGASGRDLKPFSLGQAMNSLENLGDDDGDLEE